MFGGFAPSCEAKNASASGAPSPSHSKRAASAFCSNPAPAARMFGGFAPSCEAKPASTSGAPSPSHSKRAASALYITYAFYLIPLRFLLCVVV